MKEKIKELKRQATIKIQSHGAFGEPESREQLDVDKFAELIIRECIKIADNRGAYKVIDDIIDHFGVEE